MAATLADCADCPFCGKPPAWINKPGSYGYYPETRRLACVNRACPVQPSTTPRPTEDWTAARGHFLVDHDAEHVAAWNTRA